MFSNLAIGLLVGVGFAGWAYSKLQRNTGGNTQSSLIEAAISGLVALAVVVTILGFVFK